MSPTAGVSDLRLGQVGPGRTIPFGVLLWAAANLGPASVPAPFSGPCPAAATFLPAQRLVYVQCLPSALLPHLLPALPHPVCVPAGSPAGTAFQGWHQAAQASGQLSLGPLWQERRGWNLDPRGVTRGRGPGRCGFWKPLPLGWD